jgi:hypothetical protein
MDVGFLGAEPHRANEIDCSAAYVEIEADPGSALRPIDEVDGAQYRGELVEDIKATGVLPRMMENNGVRVLAVAAGAH